MEQQQQPQQQQPQQEQPQQQEEGNDSHCVLTTTIPTTTSTASPTIPFYQPHYNIHNQQHQQQQQLHSTLSPPQSNGGGSSDGGAPLPYQNTTSAPPPPTGEPQRRKRGRPRKYETPEAAAAARKAALANPKPKKIKAHQQFVSPISSSYSPPSNDTRPPSGGQGFTPHIIHVPDGQDIGQRIMTFLQQSRREMCVLSASGFISYASLRQQNTSGGCQTYEGYFEIISLNGSYVHSQSGAKAGGLSVCFSDTVKTDKTTLGGGVSGPLVAAGPVQVVVATFTIDQKKDGSAGFKGDASVSMPSPISTSTPVYRPVVESSRGFGVINTNNHQSMGGSPFMMQPQWRVGIEYDMSGNTTHDTHKSPENGDYEH